jgi:hypothetical protein
MAVTATLSEADLLRVWEEGSAQPPAGRALVLLAAANPGFSLNQLAQLTVGERDELLLDLRERCLGPALPGWADCPGCAQALEVTIEADQVRAAWGAEVPTEGSVHAAGYEIRFRLPTSRDALAVDHWDANGPRQMLARCVLGATSGGSPVPAAALEPELLDAVAVAMAGLDARIDVRVTLTCPTCGHGWAPVLDIAAYLWAEIDAAARRLLRAVHALACAYGWTEADVLAIGPWRRQAYLQAVGA